MPCGLRTAYFHKVFPQNGLEALKSVTAGPLFCRCCCDGDVATNPEQPAGRQAFGACAALAVAAPRVCFAGDASGSIVRDLW